MSKAIKVAVSSSVLAVASMAPFGVSAKSSLQAADSIEKQVLAISTGACYIDSKFHRS